VIFTRGFGYPDSFHPSANGDVLHSIELLYLAPRVLRGLLAVEVDTFLVYEIAERRYNRNFPLSHLFFLRIIMPLSRLIRRNGRSMSRTIFIQCNRSFAMLSSRSGIVDRKPAIAFEHAWFNSTTKEVY
jgi:hypothetical protein